MTAIAMGLGEALDPRPRRDRGAHERPAPADPVPDEFTRLILRLDPDDPRDSIALVRCLSE
jgi:hypothetical protein